MVWAFNRAMERGRRDYTYIRKLTLRSSLLEPARPLAVYRTKNLTLAVKVVDAAKAPVGRSLKSVIAASQPSASGDGV